MTNVLHLSITQLVGCTTYSNLYGSEQPRNHNKHHNIHHGSFTQKEQPRPTRCRRGKCVPDNLINGHPCHPVEQHVDGAVAARISRDGSSNLPLAYGSPVAGGGGRDKGNNRWHC